MISQIDIYLLINHLAFFNLVMIIGPILGIESYDFYRYEVFRVKWSADFNVRELGIPFFISGILGLTALTLLLIFVKEPLGVKGNTK